MAATQTRPGLGDRVDYTQTIKYGGGRRERIAGTIIKIASSTFFVEDDEGNVRHVFGSPAYYMRPDSPKA